MKQLLLPALAAVLLLPAPLAAQTRSTTVPPELQESWTRFAAAWSRADLASVVPQLTPDFVLHSSAGEYRGHVQVQSDWPRARRHAGLLSVPSSFISESTTILEIGRSYAPPPGGSRPAAADGYQCAPEEDVEQLQPVSYRREWVRAADESWQVRSIVLHGGTDGAVEAAPHPATGRSLATPSHAPEINPAPE